MSTIRIRTAIKEKEQQPVPRLPITEIPEDPISKLLRSRFDNDSIQYPLWSGIFINTNESGTQTTAQRLREFPRVNQGCHIGFSGWHNFDIMALRQSTRGIICDINPENALFLYFALGNLRKCADRKTFVDAMIEIERKHDYSGMQRKNPLGIYFGPPNASLEWPYFSDEHITESEFSLELLRETSWLYNDERYAHIRTLAMQDKIALITENICAHDKFGELMEFLKLNGICVDTVYLSNIPGVLEDQGKMTACKTIMHLLKNPMTIAIDAHYPPGQKPNPQLGGTCTLFQRCYSVTEIYENELSSLTDWFFPRLREIMRRKKQLASSDQSSEKHQTRITGPT